MVGYFEGVAVEVLDRSRMIILSVTQRTSYVRTESQSKKFHKMPWSLQSQRRHAKSEV